MGLFGSKPKTTTEVKPDSRVEAILRGVVTDTMNMPEQEYINKMMAQLSPQEKGILSNVAASGDLRQAANAMSPALGQGLQQITDNNAHYQSVVNNPISVNQVLQDKQLLQNGLQATATNQGLSATNALGRDSAASRRASKINSRTILANQKISPEMGNLSISQANQNHRNTIQTAGSLNDIANSNVSRGLQGVELQDKAVQNQLNVGNINQTLSNQQNAIDYQNANGAAMFPWQNINNRLNIMNTVSGMAGYKTQGVGAGVPVGKQLAGAAISGLGIAGRLGAFESTPENVSNAWDSYDANGGQGGMMGAMPNGGSLSQQKNNQSRGIMSTIGSWF